MPTGLRLLTWNLERKAPTSPRGAEALEHLFVQQPHVAVLTEARNTMPAHAGHLVSSQPAVGAIYAPDERKVVMWSAYPWHEVDDLGHADLPPGRFVSAVTETPIGEVRVVGVCMPWHMAGVRYGAADKRPWEVHVRYLEVLADVVASFDSPTVVAGDFNQFVPRTWGPRAAEAALLKALDGFEIATNGQLDGCDRVGIDHIAIGTGLTCARAWGWKNVVGDARLSDHDGAGCEILGETARDAVRWAVETGDAALR